MMPADGPARTGKISVDRKNESYFGQTRNVCVIYHPTDPNLESLSTLRTKDPIGSNDNISNPNLNHKTDHP